MIAAPWYLLAGGIVLVIIAFFMAGLSGASRNNPPEIHADMSDEDIARNVKKSGSLTSVHLVLFLGVILIAVSLVWRIVRAVM